MGLLLLSCGIYAFGQSRGSKGLVSGTVVDGDDNSPVMQATVQILALKDSSMVAGNVTDLDGRFSLSARPGKYLLKVSFVGYSPSFQPITLTSSKPRLNLGTISLHSDAVMLEGAVIVAQAPEVTAAEDTLVYNSSAYRVPEGSALEELVKKLPGAEIDDDGKITINGKKIKKIMIDGKEFFADDPNIAMKNLPVNIIDKIRAYEKQSDMARMTGVDDGEEETVLDLSVKPGMNQGWIGNTDLAAGTKDRYSGKVMINHFRNKNQLTAIGSVNNVNDNAFPGGGGGFRKGGNGLTAVKMAGVNFATETEKLKTEGSVNFNYKDADIVSKQASETFVSSESSSFKNALDHSRNKNTKLVADAFIEWKPDTMTTFVFRPRFSYGKTDNTNGQNSYTFSQDPGYTTDELFGTDDLTSLVSEEDIINTVLKNTLKKGDDLTVGGSVLVNRRLGKLGRNITFRGKYNYTNSSSEQFSTSETEYFQKTPEERMEILNRYITTPTKSYDYSARLTYSEPIFTGGFLQFSYNFQYKHSTTDNSTFDMGDNWTIGDGVNESNPGVLNNDLSKSAAYNYYNHQMDVTFRWIREKMRLNAGVSFQPQKSDLSYKKGDLDTTTVRNVFNFTPTFDFRYNFSKTSQLRLRYRGQASQPNMVDLLPISDNTDPLNIQNGNPELKPTFTNELRAEYNFFNTEKQRGMFSFFRYQNMVSYISEKDLVSDTDKNITKRLSLGERLRGTYRNDWWEFSLNGSLDYTHSRNSYQESNNLDTYQFAYGASTNVRLPWNMSISTDLSQNSRRGYAESSMNTDELIWNAQISQDFLKGNAATVSIQFYDILRNQSNISRVITAAMRQDTEYNAIYSYCMVHFIYRLNLFGGKGAGKGGPGFAPPGPGGRHGGFGGPPHRRF